MSVIATIPSRIALPTFRAIRIAISTTPTAARITCGSDVLPSATNVDGFATMIPALRKPTKAMKRPMPAAVPYFRQSGMPLTICSRMFVSVRTQEQNSREQDHAERRLPRDAALYHDRIGEIGVQRHAGRESDRIIRPQPHHQRSQRRRNARREKDAIHGHARLGENARIHHDHVGHGHERREAGEKLLPHRSLVFSEMKDPLEQTGFPGKTSHYRTGRVRRQRKKTRWRVANRIEPISGLTVARSMARCRRRAARWSAAPRGRA